MKKIIYVFERRHYYEHDDDLFAIKYFKEHGVDVEVWSAVKWTFGGDISTPLNVKKDEKLIYIDNELELKRRLNALKRSNIHKEDCLFVVYPDFAYMEASYIIRREIKKSGYDFCNLGEVPDLIEMKFGFYNIFKTLKFYTWRVLSITKHSVLTILKKENYSVDKDRIRKFFGPILWKSKKNIIITKSGLNNLPNKFEMYSKRNVVFPHAHCFDAKKLMGEKKQRDFIVFIDEYECGHSDWEKTGVLPPVQNKELYYKELNNFFKVLENKFCSRVIIAAHPKAEYKGTEYEGREIVYYKTPELIRDSKLVLYMYGSCGTYIALFKKRFILFCTSEAMKGHPADEFRLKVAEFFNAKLLQIDMNYDGCNLDNEITYDEERYEELSDKLGMNQSCNVKVCDYILKLLK